MASTLESRWFGVDENLNHNYRQLMASQPGQEFTLRKGKLFVVDGYRSSISNVFFKSQPERVKTTISAVVSRIKPVNLDESKVLERISHLSRDLFDRSKISEEAIEVLSPNLFALRQQKNHISDDDSKREGERKEKESKEKMDRMDPIELDYSIKVEEVKLAAKLGVEFELISAGSSGSYIGRNLAGKRTLIFKPVDEEPHAPNNPKRWTRFLKNLRTFVGIRGHRCLEGQQGSRTEAGASIIDKKFNLGIVPRTKIEEFSSGKFSYLPEGQKTQLKTGSCQLWVNGAETAEDHFYMITAIRRAVVTFVFRILGWKVSDYENLSEEHRNALHKSFQMLSFLDGMIGNLDRNPGNWLIINKDEKGNAISPKIVGIDHGLAFPSTHSNDFLSRRRQYEWASMEFANIKFGAECKALADSLSKRSVREELYTDLQKVMGAGSFTPAVRNTIEERIKALVYHVKTDKTPKQFSKVKSESDYIALRNNPEFVIFCTTGQFEPL